MREFGSRNDPSFMAVVCGARLAGHAPSQLGEGFPNVVLAHAQRPKTWASRRSFAESSMWWARSSSR